MVNEWLSRAILIMTGGSETKEQATERLAKAEAENAAGHRLLSEYAKNAREGREGEAIAEAEGVAATQTRAAAIMETNRLAKVRARKAPPKPTTKMAKKTPSPSFR